jgi:hypothetical protein
MKVLIHPILVAVFILSTLVETNAQKLAVIPYVSGMTSPIDIKHCGDNRLFIADRTGLIRIITADGNLLPTPFLNITSKISSTGSEEGFLGIAFSPNYKTDGKFYVDYTTSLSGKLGSIVQEYKVSATDSNKADVSSAFTILTQLQPFSNHNGGNLMFGKDGYLYINFGDGGGGGDPEGNGQNTKTFLGKILRIDVSNSSFEQPYVIPPTNPFYSNSTPGIKKEIWAYGMRNPWRSSVDRLTGDLWISDVGQNAHEEVNYQRVNAAGGRNYGWNIMEGSFCYDPPTGCDTTGLTLPLYDYPHPYGDAITGGYIYRSAQSKALFGTYIFGDYVAKWIDGIRQSGGTISGSVIHFITEANATGSPISFGEDIYGDQYIVFDGDGTVYRLEDTSSVRRPKAYFTTTDKGDGSFSFHGLQGRNLTYQWLRNKIAIPGASSPEYSTSVSGTYTLLVKNSLNFSDTSSGFTLSLVPLNLTSFTAQKISEGKILLYWKTASEQNVSGFTILRRQNNETGFSNIGYVGSKSLNGISSSELDYSFTDSSALRNSKLFYRLQIVNQDGSYTYSDIRTITTAAIKNGFTFYPNPAKGVIQINLDNFTQPMILVLYDHSGKKVKEETISQQNTTIQVPLLKGIYIMQLSDKQGGNMVREKLIVE